MQTPCQDGLDSVIDALQQIREASIQLAEHEQQAGQVGEPTIVLPAAGLDPLILMLEEARHYRNFLYARHRRGLTLSYWALGMSLVACLINVGAIWFAA